MGKHPEDEIQKKLVELELSIKDEESKRQVPAAPAGGTQLSVAPPSAVADAETRMAADLYKLGGWACIVFGLIMFFSHITVVSSGAGFFWGLPGTGAMGFLVVPLFVGIGMLFYNYKSRAAQLVTVGSLLAIGMTVINGLRLVFQNMVLIDFIIMGAPISIGCALLAKAHYEGLSRQKRSEDK